MLNPRPTRYPGEPYFEYRERLNAWNEQQKEAERQKIEDQQELQRMNDREIHERTRLLTLQKLREAAARPLAAEVADIQNGKAIVEYDPRRASPGDGCSSLPLNNFYAECPSEEADITLMPDDLYKRTTRVFLKRAPVTVGMKVNLFWAFDIHPIGWAAPENWIAILANGEEGQDSPLTGTVELVRSVDGTCGVAVIRLDNGTSVTVNTLLKDAPAKGANGTITYDNDNNPIFKVE